jgi:hypothetical protein
MPLALLGRLGPDSRLPRSIKSLQRSDLFPRSAITASMLLNPLRRFLLDQGEYARIRGELEHLASGAED